MSSMFVLIFNLPEITAAYLSALTLTGFLLGSFLVPFFVMDRSPSVFFTSASIFIVALIGSAAVYAVLPSITGVGTFEPGFSWRLFGFVVAKACVSFFFATMQSVTGGVAVDAVGVANLPVAYAYVYPPCGAGAALGPISAWLITFARRYDGMTFSRAFALFFYIAAGLCGLNALLVGIIMFRIQSGLRLDRMETEKSHRGASPEFHSSIETGDASRASRDRLRPAASQEPA